MGSNKIIEGPVLLFLHDKVNVMNYDDLLSNASSFYNEDETKAARQTLYRVMECESNFVDRSCGCASKKSVINMIRKVSIAPS